MAVAVSVTLGGGLVTIASPAVAASPEAPEVTVESPVNIDEANLHGVLNPKKAGAPGEYQFLYKESTTLECKGGSVAPIPPGGAAGGEHEEPAQTLTGLVPDTEYAVCLREENLLGGESAVSSAVSFKTAEATAPVVVSQGASPTHVSATVSAQINPGGLATTCEVKYGKTAALEATPIPCPTALPAGDTEQTATAELKGLEPKTEYHVEFVATNGKGTTAATEQATFKTGPYPPPFVITFGPSEVKRARADLGEVPPGSGGGLIVPSEGEETVYYFEYGTEACSLATETCGVKTPTRGPVTSFANAEPFKVTRLKPGTTYHYWLVASGPGGTTHGEEMSFTTATAEPKEYVYEKNLEAHSPVGLGVDQANGDVYVATQDGTIEQFNATGGLLSSVKIPGSVYQLAVDNSGLPGQEGDVYVADVTENVVYKFVPNSEGKLELDKTTPEIGKGSLNEPRGVAVNSSGDINITSTVAGVNTVSEYSPAGALINKDLITGINSPPGQAAGLAIDKNGNIYYTCLNGTAEYTSAGKCVEVEVISPEKCKLINDGSDNAVALDATGDVFVSVNPAGIFEYAPSIGHPSIQNPALEASGAFSTYPRGVAVNETSHTLYVSENAGVVKVFRFLDVKPVIVKTKEATPVSGPIETLNGTVNPGGQEPAEYYFEYGTSPCLPETCGTVATEPSQVPLYGDEPISVSARLDNLAPNTTYHYRIVGVNEESGVEYGGEQTFTTGGAAPSPPAPTPEGAAPESKTPASSPVYPLLTGIAPVPGPGEPGCTAGRRCVPIITRAQRLAKALATCNRKPKRQRATCKRQARRRYGPVTKSVARRKRRK